MRDPDQQPDRHPGTDQDSEPPDAGVPGPVHTQDPAEGPEDRGTSG